MSDKSDKKKQKEEEEKIKRDIVQEVEEELSESSDDEEDEELSLLGFLELKKGPKGDYKPVYAIVSAGSLFWYKDSRDSKAAGTVALKGYTIDPNVEGQKKEFAVELKGPDAFFLAFTSTVDKQKWVTVLTDASAKPAAANPPVRDGSSKKQGMGARAKKRMAGSVASSALGKKVMKAVLNEESTSLLAAMKRIVSKSDGKKKAEELEKSIIKLMVKGYLLMDNKKIEGDAFLAADKPLRQAFELLARCYKNRSRAKHDALVEALGRVEGMLSQAEKIITELLQPHLSPKNMFRLASTFGYLGSQKFLENAFNDAELDEELEKLIDAMEYYTDRKSVV